MKITRSFLFFINNDSINKNDLLIMYNFYVPVWVDPYFQGRIVTKESLQKVFYLSKKAFIDQTKALLIQEEPKILNLENKILLFERNIENDINFETFDIMIQPILDISLQHTSWKLEQKSDDSYITIF